MTGRAPDGNDDGDLLLGHEVAELDVDVGRMRRLAGEEVKNLRAQGRTWWSSYRSSEARAADESGRNLGDQSRQHATRARFFKRGDTGLFQKLNRFDPADGRRQLPRQQTPD